MENPTSMEQKNPMIKGLRFPTRSENQATMTARMAAVM